MSLQKQNSPFKKEKRQLHCRQREAATAQVHRFQIFKMPCPGVKTVYWGYDSNRTKKLKKFVNEGTF